MRYERNRMLKKNEWWSFGKASVVGDTGST